MPSWRRVVAALAVAICSGTLAAAELRFDKTKVNNVAGSIGYSGSAKQLVLSPDGELAAVACTDKRVVVLDAATGEVVEEVASDALEVGFAADSAGLCLCEPRTTRVHTVKGRERDASAPEPAAVVGANRLLRSPKRELLLYNPGSGKLAAAVKPKYVRLEGLGAASPVGDQVAVVAKSGGAAAVEFISLPEKYSRQYLLQDPSYLDVAFSSDGKYFLVGQRGLVVVMNAKTKTVAGFLEPPRQPTPSPTAVAEKPRESPERGRGGSTTGAAIVSGADDGYLVRDPRPRSANTATAEEPVRYTSVAAGVNGLAMTDSDDRTLRVWNLATCKQVAVFGRSELGAFWGDISCLEISRLGDRAAFVIGDEVHFLDLSDAIEHGDD